MVVRADNVAYGKKACQFLGTSLKGKGKVVMLEGDMASINGRDRTEAFNELHEEELPGHQGVRRADEVGRPDRRDQLQTALTANPDIKGVYMESSFALAGTMQVLKQKGLPLPPPDPKHVFVVSNDGIPEELKDIAAGMIDATVSQPADLYAKYGHLLRKAAIAGKTFAPGPTDHDSTIIQVRPGVLEDQLAAPLVTHGGGDFGTA